MIAIDNSPVRLACAAHNAALYGVADRIQFILADYLTWADSYAKLPASPERPPIDVVFLSPPWGGVDYMQAGPVPVDANDSIDISPAEPTSTDYTLASLQPVPGKTLYDVTAQLTKEIAFFLPRNTSINELAALAGDGQKVEIEEEWMGRKLKALTAYYGKLANAA